MSAALRPVDLPPEAISLIKEGTPKSLGAAPSLAARPEEPEKPKAPTQSQPMAAPGLEPELAGIPPKAKSKMVPGKDPAVAERELLVSMSFRLPEGLLEALLRAASERKIKRLRPFTQQEIVAEALSGWLKRNGYL